jgi:hypothetical protein
MADMSLDFKALPKNDLEAWKIIRVLYEHGFGSLAKMPPPLSDTLISRV